MVYPQNHLFSPSVFLLGMPHPEDSVHCLSTPSFWSYVLSSLSAAFEEVVTICHFRLSIQTVKPLTLSTFFLSFRLNYFYWFSVKVKPFFLSEPAFYLGISLITFFFFNVWVAVHVCLHVEVSSDVHLGFCFLRFIFILCEWVFKCPCAYRSHGGQKRVLGLLELELQTVMSVHVGAGNQA